MLKPGDLVEITNVYGIAYGWRYFESGDTTELIEQGIGLALKTDRNSTGGLYITPREYDYIRKVGE